MSEPRTPPAVEREYLSMAELATYSGMSRRWLEERLHNAIDALPSFPFGRRCRVKRSEFDAWAARRRAREQRDVAALVDDAVNAVLHGGRMPRPRTLTTPQAPLPSSRNLNRGRDGGPQGGS